MAKRKHERTCIVDGTKYEYCSHCGEFDSTETWRYLYCSQNCKAIYEICAAFATGKIDAIEARVKLNRCDLSNIDNFHKNIQKNIQDIYSSDEELSSDETNQLDVSLTASEDEADKGE